MTGLLLHRSGNWKSTIWTLATSGANHYQASTCSFYNPVLKLRESVLMKTLLHDQDPQSSNDRAVTTPQWKLKVHKDGSHNQGLFAHLYILLLVGKGLLFR